MATDNGAIKQLLTKFWVWLGGQPTATTPASSTSSEAVAVAAESESPSVLGADLRPAARYTYTQAKKSSPRQTITVQEGDTLYNIADLVNVSVQALIQANSLTSPKIYIGQRLLLPENASPPPVRPAKNAPTQTTPKKPALRVERKPQIDPDPRDRVQGQLNLDLPVEKPTKATAKPQSPPRQTPKQSHPAPKREQPATVKRPTATPLKEATKSAATLPRPTVVPPPQNRPAMPAPPSATKAPQPPKTSTRPPHRETPTPTPVTRPQPVKPAPIADNMGPPPAVSKPAQLNVPPEINKPVPPTPKPAPAAKADATFSRSALLGLSKPSPADQVARKSVEETKEVAEQVRKRKTGPLPTLQSEQPVEQAIPKPIDEVPREPVHFPQNAVQAMYIAYHQLGNIQTLIELRSQLENSRLNAVIIDIKNEYGSLSYQSQVPMAATLKANRRLVLDMPKLVAAFKHEGIYTIGRVVSFKDPLLAAILPELAAKQPYSSATWLDRQGLAWADPFQPEVWQYNLDLAQEAATFGFDEILFDALRFPAPGASGNPRFSQLLSTESRLTAISGFLSTAKGSLAPTSIKIGATLTNYACWREDDNLVGHNIERLAPYLDVMAPILYPSAFETGIPGYPNPMLAIESVVTQSTQQAVARSQQRSAQCQIRPWLQDFQDDAFDKRIFGQAEIQAQINGAVRGGAAGYSVWNPQSSYTFSAYKKAR